MKFSCCGRGNSRFPYGSEIPSTHPFRATVAMIVIIHVTTELEAFHCKIALFLMCNLVGKIQIV